VCSKYYRNWSALVKAIVKWKRVTVFWTTVYIQFLAVNQYSLFIDMMLSWPTLYCCFHVCTYCPMSVLCVLTWLCTLIFSHSILSLEISTVIISLPRSGSRVLQSACLSVCLSVPGNAVPMFMKLFV